MIINFHVLFLRKSNTYLPEERLEIQAIADDISSKYVPPHVNVRVYSLYLKVT
jgi:hypothetical protein